MSFLLKRRNIFLFVFVFCLAFLNSSSLVFAQNLMPAPVKTPEGNTLHPLSNTETEGWVEGSDKGIVDQTKDMVLGEGLEWLVTGTAWIITKLGNMAQGVASLLLGLVSYLFEIFVQIGVYGISDIVGGAGTESPIKKVWEIFRNLANVGIIFIILFISIKTVLGASDYGAKKLLGSVIIASFLINFSFLFGAIVVDVSNVMAETLYNNVKEETGASSDQSANFGRFMVDNSGISIFSTVTARTSDGNTKKDFEEAKESTDWETIKNLQTTEEDSKSRSSDKMVYEAVSVVFGVISTIILAVVLAMAAFMLVGRLISILLLLVVSPIAFASMILPNTKQISSQWWKNIIGQSFFFPVFLLFIYIGIKVIKVMQKMDLSGYINNLNTGQEGFFVGTAKIMAAAGFSMSITIGLFVAALIMAKKVSEMGGGAAGTISSKVSSFVGGAALGAAAVSGRRVIGGSANYAADKLAKSDSKFAKSRYGMATLTSLKGVAKSSFDARESRAFKGVASATGVGGDLNKNFSTTKGGYEGQKKRAVDARTKRAGYLSDKLTSEQEIEKATRENNMESMVNDDHNVIVKDKAIKSAENQLKAANAVNNVADIQRAQADLRNAKIAANEAREAVQASDAYKAEKEAAEAIISRRGAYGKRISATNKWLPSYAANKAAGEKILKSLNLSDEDKRTNQIISALRDTNK